MIIEQLLLTVPEHAGCKGTVTKTSRMPSDNIIRNELSRLARHEHEGKSFPCPDEGLNQGAPQIVNFERMHILTAWKKSFNRV